MLQLVKKFKLKNIKYKLQCFNELKRHISALYITGDKANEHYVTLQPYMNFEQSFKDQQALTKSIESRKLNTDLAKVLQKYEKFLELQHQLKELENMRDIVADQLRKLMKNPDPKMDPNEIKEKGKNMRNQLKSLKETFYPIEDDFVHDFLNLPNLLHSDCPTTAATVIYNHQTSKATVLEKSGDINKLSEFIDEQRYYLLEDAALIDLSSMHCMQQHMMQQGNFIPVTNPDFVRCVLLEANGTPLENYHQVLEENLQNKINTAYLTGGGAFESFLGAVTKLSVYSNVIPLRWVSCGRSYQKPREGATPKNLYNVTQTNAVQVFVATKSAEEANAEMQHIIELTTKFYKEINIPFRVVYNKASDLTLSECLRASLEIYSPALKSYVCLGYISNYSDFVSKRILFNIRDKSQYNFPHLLGGPLLQTTRLIAGLNEYEIPLKTLNFLGDLKNNVTVDKHTNIKAIN